MRDEFRRPIAQLLESHRVADFRFKVRSKHDSVEFLFAGKQRTFFFPCSGSDWRGPANAITQLKRLMGLTGAPANDNKNRRPLKHAKPRRPASKGMRRPSAPAIEAPVARADKWFSHLEIIRNRLVAVGEKPIATSGANDNKMPATLSLPVVRGGTRVRLTTPWLGKRVRWATI